MPRGPGDPIDGEDLTFESSQGCASYKGQRIRLSPRTLEVLQRIHDRHPNFVSNEDLRMDVWGTDVDPNLPQQHITKLNQTLPKFGLYVHGVPNFGYFLARIDDGLISRQTAGQKVLHDGNLRPESRDLPSDDQPEESSRLASAKLTRAKSAAGPPTLLTNGTLPDHQAGARALTSFKESENDWSTRGPAKQLAADAEAWSDFILEVSKADEKMVRFTEKFNASDSRIIGSVIEIFAHRYLDSNLSLAETGWLPNQIRLVDGGLFDTSAIAADPRVLKAFSDSEALRQADGKGTALQQPNNFKYVLSDTSTPFQDTSELTLTVRQTDYFSILRARPAVERIPEIWMEYGHIHPSGNRIPHALSIHFSAIFNEREILCIQRDRNTYPFPGTWSFSGEEQFEKSDMEWDEPDRMRYTMLRTAQEELFPLARISEKRKLIGAMRMVEPLIQSMRIWSVFLEGPIATFQLFCVYEFAFPVAEYADLVKRMVRRALGQPSREGRYFSVNLDDVPAFLTNQSVEARPIFGGEPVLIHPNDMHPTSRYRLVRLLNVLRNRS